MSEENISLKVDTCLELADAIQDKLKYMIDGRVPEEEKRAPIRPNLQGISEGLGYLEKTLRNILEDELAEVDGYILHGAELK